MIFVVIHLFFYILYLLLFNSFYYRKIFWVTYCIIYREKERESDFIICLVSFSFIFYSI